MIEELAITFGEPFTVKNGEEPPKTISKGKQTFVCYRCPECKRYFYVSDSVLFLFPSYCSECGGISERE